MTSPFDAHDAAITDLSWRFGQAESELGAHGQSVDGSPTDARVFDDEASWRKMHDMLSERRVKAIARCRLIDAAMAQCPEHVGTFRLAFVPFGRASAPVLKAFTSGRVVLLGLAMASPTARELFEASKSKSLVDWLDELSKNLKSWPTFERMRLAAQNRLLPALTAYGVAAGEVREADRKARREAHERRVRGIQDEAAKSRPVGEPAESRTARILADTLRLKRAAGVE